MENVNVKKTNSRETEKFDEIIYYSPIQMSREGHNLTKEGILELIKKWYENDTTKEDDERIAGRWITDYGKGDALMGFLHHSMTGTYPKEFYHLMTIPADDRTNSKYFIYLSDGFVRHEDVEINGETYPSEEATIYYFLTVYKVITDGDSLPF